MTRVEFFLVFSTVLLVSLVNVPVISGAASSPQQTTHGASYAGMLVIANARGEYGKYWQWWPPGFVDKPQLMAESYKVFMHWSDDISNIYVNEGKSVHRLYSYYWIIQNPSDTPNDLINAIYNDIDEYSSHWNLLLLVGHANPTAWEAYYWNHAQETYFSTYMFIPNNNNWASSDGDVIAAIYPSEVRVRLGDHDWFGLPHIVFVIGCDSLDYLTDTGGWAWGFYLSADDYSYDWLWRGIVGFQGPVYYNWVTGDFKAAELAKKMLEYMNQGYSSINAFRYAAEDTNFPYKIYQEPASTDMGEGDGNLYAVYIGDNAWQDPSSGDVALKTSVEFMKSYMHTIYELAINSSVQPIVENLTGKTWYARLVDEPVYRISWKIPVASRTYKNVTYIFEVGFTVIVDGVGKIKSVSLMGSVYETPKIVSKYSRSDIMAMKHEIREIMENDLESLNSYAGLMLNTTPTVIGLRMAAKDREDKIYHLVLRSLDAPIYVNDSNRVSPLSLEVITDNKTLFVYDNSLILLSKYMGRLENLNANIIPYGQAKEEFMDEISGCKQCRVTHNLSLIVIINTRNHEITPYYYAVYFDDKDNVHMVYINAYTGEKKTVSMEEAYIPENNNMPENITYSLMLLITVLTGAAVGIIYYLVRRKRT